jgi:hypothetical protein
MRMNKLYLGRRYLFTFHTSILMRSMTKKYHRIVMEVSLNNNKHFEKNEYHASIVMELYFSPILFW